MVKKKVTSTSATVTRYVLDTPSRTKLSQWGRVDESDSWILRHQKLLCKVLCWMIIGVVVCNSSFSISASFSVGNGILYLTNHIHENYE